jgi:predicted amino acid racemase
VIGVWRDSAFYDGLAVERASADAVRTHVDMSSPKPIQDTMDLLGQLLDELEKLLK